MRWVMVSVCLATMLCSHLTKQVEAASGLARALGAMACAHNERDLANTDLDLDADQEEMTLRTRGCGDGGGTSRAFLNPRKTIARLLTPLPAPSLLTAPGTIPGSLHTPWPPQGAGRRHAWLQHFRF